MTILPSTSGGNQETTNAGTSSEALAATAVTLPSENSAGGDSADSQRLATIQQAISSGAVSSTIGQVLENRILAIEQLSAVYPNLDVAPLDDRVMTELANISNHPAPDIGFASTFNSSGDSIAVDGSTADAGLSLEADRRARTVDIPSGRDRRYRHRNGCKSP